MKMFKIKYILLIFTIIISFQQTRNNKSTLIYGHCFNLFIKIALLHLEPSNNKCQISFK
jgi:hypothetical protein